MAKIPPYREVQTSSVPGAPEWLRWLLVPLNQFFRLVFSALDHGLNFSDNFETQEFNYRVTGGVPFEFPLTLSRPAKLIFVQQYIPVTSSGPVTVVWQAITKDNQPWIQVIDITGLVANTVYDVRILVL